MTPQYDLTSKHDIKPQYGITPHRKFLDVDIAIRVFVEESPDAHELHAGGHALVATKEIEEILVRRQQRRQLMTNNGQSAHMIEKYSDSRITLMYTMKALIWRHDFLKSCFHANTHHYG